MKIKDKHGNSYDIIDSTARSGVEELQNKIDTQSGEIVKLNSAKVGYAEYSNSYLSLYDTSAKGTLIAKLLIEGGSGSDGITEAKCREIVEGYGYAVASDFYSKSEIDSKTSVTQMLTEGTEIAKIGGTSLFAPKASSGEEIFKQSITLAEDTHSFIFSLPYNCKKIYIHGKGKTSYSSTIYDKPYIKINGHLFTSVHYCSGVNVYYAFSSILSMLYNGDGNIWAKHETTSYSQAYNVDVDVSSYSGNVSVQSYGAASTFDMDENMYIKTVEIGWSNSNVNFATGYAVEIFGVIDQ